jgi:septin family protein
MAFNMNELIGIDRGISIRQEEEKTPSSCISSEETEKNPLESGQINKSQFVKKKNLIGVKNQLPVASASTLSMQEKVKDEAQRMVVQASMERDKKREARWELDPKFVCDQETFQKVLPAFQQQISACINFDIAAFLRGFKGISLETLKSNEKILDDAIQFIGQQAKALAGEKNISREDAYKLLIGILDQYDAVAYQLSTGTSNSEPPSTFVLRSAILLSGQQEGIALQSWMVYTKIGKPDHKHLWTFLDDWKNWVPEAQGAMAKFSEITIAKVKKLARQHVGNQIILLKGGFGAGKTRLANELMQENAAGVVAPDLGKRVVRRAMPSVMHSSAHIQGSQIAFKIFDAMIQEQEGTIVYDSSLSKADDVKSYLQKSKISGKKMIIYDVARHDMARALAVLKRDVEGDDPRIPPDFIIRSAIQDKLNRAECMKVILEYVDDKSVPPPEYHFIAGDRQGWNTAEVMTLLPKKIRQAHRRMKKRLEFEGIEIDRASHTVRFTKTSAELENYFNNQFERPVHAIMHDLSEAEQSILYETFSKRKLDLNPDHGSIDDASTFYEALPKNIQAVLPKNAVIQAFAAVKPETRKEFFAAIQAKLQAKREHLEAKLQEKIKRSEKHLALLKKKQSQGKGAARRNKREFLDVQIAAYEKHLELLNHDLKTKTFISYLDLPLRIALMIHQSLQKDPWR